MNGGKGLYVGGTLDSILISLLLYFSGRRESAIFVRIRAPNDHDPGSDPVGRRLDPASSRGTFPRTTNYRVVPRCAPADTTGAFWFSVREG